MTLREFNAGEYAEVDYAEDRIEWIDQNGEIHQAHVLIGILCFSQLIFAWVAPNEEKENWLLSHQKMFEVYGAFPKSSSAIKLKNGVVKSHL